MDYYLTALLHEQSLVPKEGGERAVWLTSPMLVLYCGQSCTYAHWGSCATCDRWTETGCIELTLWKPSGATG